LPAAERVVRLGLAIVHIHSLSLGPSFGTAAESPTT
jgi:hypothetical protein